MEEICLGSNQENGGEVYDRYGMFASLAIEANAEEVT